jgi:DNA gyrase subunit A
MKVSDFEEEKFVFFATKYGQSLRFEETQVRSLSRSSRGNIGIKLGKEDDCVVSIARIRTENPEKTKVLSITENGYGKLSDVSDYVLHNRGGMGNRTCSKNFEKYGTLCGLKVVDTDDDIIVISDNGIVIRVRAGEIRECSRSSGGVKIMRLPDGNKVISFTRTDHDEEEVFESVDNVIEVDDTMNN